MHTLVIGSGFSSLAAACYLAQSGHRVTVLEKNSDIGGRARQYKRDGFCFDIGPTFYWMPDVFDRFFKDFGKSPSDYYKLEQLNPGYEVFFGEKDSIKVSSKFDEIKDRFEQEEPGSGAALQSFIDLAEDNYNIAIKDLVYKPGVSPLELVTPKTITKVGQFTSTIRSQVAKKLKSPKLKSILEFPVLFLGAKPSNTPGFYNFMNYADFKLGTWHPHGGMYMVIKAMEKLATELGVEIIRDANVTKFELEGDKIKSVHTTDKEYTADVIVSGADYHHTETLLPKSHRQYSESYWDKKVFAPSALLFYVGFDKKLDNVSHHTLFFDTPFDEHAYSIYDKPDWPKKPLFYASFPSLTDNTAAPEGKEAGIFLIPLAPDLEDTEAIRNEYFEKIMTRFENLTGQSIKEHVLFQKSYCVNDFKEDYNSYKGNAYGLANILLQTAFLRPKLKSKKVSNLFFTGQLTVPGPGVPPSLISGKITCELIQKQYNN